MSTVRSIEVYAKIRGIHENVSLAQFGSADWELVRDSVGEFFADQYSSALIYTADAEVKLIWGIESYIPYETSSAELIYSAAKFHARINRRRARYANSPAAQRKNN